MPPFWNEVAMIIFLQFDVLHTDFSLLHYHESTLSLFLPEIARALIDINSIDKGI